MTGCEFGPFRYDPEQRLLFRDEEIVPLVPKAIDTLHALLERRGRIVEKAELMKLVWPDTSVEDVGLARNISLLRKVLEGDGGPSYIETIPRRGYRFLAAEAAPVSIPAPTSPPRLPSSRRAVWIALAMAAFASLVYWQFYVPSQFLAQEKGPSLAVVPFDCLTPELERESFAQGLDELIVADLSKLGGLSVVSPSTVRRHRNMRMSMGLMGRLLGLAVLVEGTVQKIDDRIRVTARLVDVHTGKLIWAESYENPGPDWGAVQTTVARDISTQVGAHLAIHDRFGPARKVSSTIPKDFGSSFRLRFAASWQWADQTAARKVAFDEDDLDYGVRHGRRGAAVGGTNAAGRDIPSAVGCGGVLPVAPVGADHEG